MVAAAITDVPGSSDVLLASLVTYSNESKHQLLGVAKDIIDTFGAVSAACAWAMARGAQARTDADIAVAITGIAGPDGGSEKKPVGTVIFGRAERSEPAESAQTRDYRFDPAEGRSGIRRQAVAVALELLLPVP
jgi:nicotinamide-nucleotide amidase